jgi:HTH-type transcriptional regulator, sugar sensing transcriptional regulator
VVFLVIFIRILIFYPIMDQYTDQLIALGLTEGESKVYIALLKNGQSTVTPILRLSKVASSNVYDILERLIGKGLVSYILKSKTRYYQAAPPATLADYINRKQEKISEEKIILSNILPVLTTLSSYKTQTAEIFLGFKGLRNAYEKLLFNGKRGDSAYFVYNPPLENKSKEVLNKIDRFFLTIDKLYKTKGINYSGVTTEPYRNSLFAKEYSWCSMRYVNFPLSIDAEIYKDKLLLISWQNDDNPIAILITSEDMTQQLRKYFQSVWKLAKE